uniref:Cobalamin adenosyltransferase-like domain-containing protein n=1 Tax=Guillardia theta TaxID=55529 RepID=A0A7S4L9D3_GUITH|mmetsp:Transcript_40299/g.126857  ORF Transcript_40299/g.126857 Transcript_40299/m.126857 type:complete len:145 (+) Transcript_40299:577-1011(+)
MCNSAAHELARCRLLDLGAHIATPTSEKTAEKVKRMKVEDVWVDDLELWIDEMDKELPPLKNFILPSGGLASATLHNARTVCRRAERNVVALQQDEQAVIDASAVRYLNRLSDFLFVSARRCAKLAGKPEALYQSGHGLKTRSH